MPTNSKRKQEALRSTSHLELKKAKQPRLFETIASNIKGSSVARVFTRAPVANRISRPVAPKKDTPEPEVDAFDDGSSFPSMPGAFPTQGKPSHSFGPSPAGIKITQSGGKARRYENSDKPLLTFIAHRQEYLDAMLELEGRGRLWGSGLCNGCGSGVALLRCTNCASCSGVCEVCLVAEHRNLPDHIIEGSRWNGVFFETVSLKSLGHRTQLGHAFGRPCPNRHSGHAKFVLVSSTGIHSIAVDFCHCPEAPSHFAQLMENQWWPGSYGEPQTAFTMSGLKLFHVLNLKGKVAPTDYVRTLEELLNGDGLGDSPKRLEQFMIVIREWRHLKMSKRSGRAHDPAGLAATKPGGNSLDCRTCPIPEVNLPDNWRDAPDDIKWIYALILAEDANFKQKARLRSTDGRDPSLGPGWATFVASDAYLEHLAKHVDSNEISHCVGFSAMMQANNKKGKGLRATGIGAVSCARHEMFRANGMGDLQVGERYSNMDYIFLSTLVACTVAWVIASYDIACQWGTNFFKRMAIFPDHLKLPSNLKLSFLVPKFHLPAHVPRCYAPYSFNFAPGVGRTDGEGVERNWSWLNGIAKCVSMMGIGGRWDTLDDFCNYANWRKTLALEKTMLRKLSTALDQVVVHYRAFAAFTDGLRDNQAADIIQWEKDVQKWENDKSQPCPYDLPRHEATQADIRRLLAEEELSRSSLGEVIINFGSMTPSGYISAALSLEELQLKIRFEAKSAKSPSELTAVQSRRTLLSRKIVAFEKAQETFLPGLGSYIQQHPSTSADRQPHQPELLPLHLPSSFNAATRKRVGLTGLDEIESRLREPQCFDILAELRSQLLKRSIANRHKAKNVDSQRTKTRLRGLQEQIESKIAQSADHYRIARKALLSLRGPGKWEESLQELQKQDLRGMHEKALRNEEAAELEQTKRMGCTGADDGTQTPGEDNNDVPHERFDPVLALGEGRRTLSWIWYHVSEEERKTGELNGYLRVEWLKARARYLRWAEEITLLPEEMRRATQYCTWKSEWWRQQAKRRTFHVSPYLQEGLVAYAEQQSSIESRQAVRWTEAWAALLERTALVKSKELSPATEEEFVLPEMTLDLDAEEENDALNDLNDDEDLDEN